MVRPFTRYSRSSAVAHCRNCVPQGFARGADSEDRVEVVVTHAPRDLRPPSCQTCKYDLQVACSSSSPLEKMSFRGGVMFCAVVWNSSAICACVSQTVCPLKRTGCAFGHPRSGRGSVRSGALGVITFHPDLGMKPGATMVSTGERDDVCREPEGMARS